MRACQPLANPPRRNLARVDRSISDSQDNRNAQSLYKDMPKSVCFQPLLLAGAALPAPLPFSAQGSLSISMDRQEIVILSAGNLGEVSMVYRTLTAMPNAQPK